MADSVHSPSKVIRRLIRDDVTGRLPSPLDARGHYPLSEADIRKDLAELFSGEPLVKLTQKETSLVRHYYADMLRVGQDASATKRDQSLTGKRYVPYVCAYSLYRAFKDSAYGHGSRGAYDYFTEEAFDGHVKSGLERKDVVYAADFGAARCEFISLKKQAQADPGRLHVTATSLEYTPHQPVDEFVLCPFEWFPKKFGCRFDIAVSQTAWEYSPLPHIALRNMAATLAPGGVALLSYGSPIGLLEFPQFFTLFLGSRDSIDSVRDYLDFLKPMSNVPWRNLRSKNEQCDILFAQTNALIADEVRMLMSNGFDVQVIASTLTKDPEPIDPLKLGHDHTVETIRLMRGK